MPLSLDREPSRTATRVCHPSCSIPAIRESACPEPAVRRKLLLAALIAFITTAGGAAAVPIGDLHQNDANGEPAPPYTRGTPVTVTGIVTVPDTVFHRFSTAIHVQDVTGGIYVYQAGAGAWDFELGDSVTVSGAVEHFYGLTEVANLTQVTIHQRGLAVPPPVLLTCAQVNQTFDPITFREDHESRLIRINDVTITAGTWPTTPTGTTNLTITDSSGATTLTINQNSELNGSPEPPTVFSIIGVLQQSDPTAPYTASYRIVPRFLSDVTGQGPRILAGPDTTDVTPTSARIVWTTDLPSTSEVEYGPTTSYGNMVTDPTPVTQHSVLLSPIADASYWNYRVASEDASGTTTSSNRAFITPPATDEAIMVYFNKSIDPAYAAGKVAAGLVPLDVILIRRIEAAEHSIDVALYSLSLPQIADALIAAHQRGIQVRAIKEWDTSTFQWNRLLAAGIPGIDSHFGGNHSSLGVHHNKFFVFDARDATTTLDDWVITGSWNPTYQGTDDDAQNIVEIKDTEVAEAYTAEFNEMWGSTTNVPDPALSRMGTEKYNDTQHLFDVNGIPVEVYFAPSDGHENIMMARIGNDAHHAIYFSILTLTRDSIEMALHNKRDLIPGFEVRGVFDRNLEPESRYYQMIGQASPPWSPPADVHLGDYSPGYLHHKTMIIDSGHPDSDPLVITGSPNWTNAARTVNDENQVYIHDYSITRQFLQEFAERYHVAGGTGPLGQGSGIGEQPVPAGGRRLELAAAPNPFSRTAEIGFELAGTSAARLRIFDASGRLVRELDLGVALAAGAHRRTWDGRDARGRSVPAGIYYYRLDAAGQHATRALVRVR